jgi:hypothetical protein
MDNPVAIVNEKVLNWLKEERLSPEVQTDPQTYFNIKISIDSRSLHVVQPLILKDAIYVGIGLSLTSQQQDILRTMGKEKRQEYFWELLLELLKNNELGDYQIKPKPPEDVRDIRISSRRIYYDGLTKDALLKAILVVYKAANMVLWIMERVAGAPIPRSSAPSFYT